VRRAGAEDDPQRRCVVGADHVVAEIEDPLQHGGHHHQFLDLVLRERLQRRPRVEATSHDRGRAEGDGEQELRQPGAVEERRAQKGALAEGTRDPVEELRGGER
jgi:hypothetical protein